jgi:hypothetical protein
MQSRGLHTALTKFIESAAIHLQAEVDAGAEVPFELGSQTGRRGRGATPLYCYRALTAAFIAEHQIELERLPGHSEAAKLLEGFDGLDRYLASVGATTDPTRSARPARRVRQPRAPAAIRVLLADVFDEQTDFEVHPERVQAALERLERAEAVNSNEVTLVATLHGLTITSAELAVTKGLTIAHPDALEGLPDGALSPAGGEPVDDHLVVALTLSEAEEIITDGDARDAAAQGRDIFKDLLRALRLFGDGRVAMGALAWMRVGDSGWNPLALGLGGRPHGMLVVTAEQEDELRSFCNLVSRRAPHGNQLAWALRRFELGCERENPHEALTDHLFALRAVVEPEGPASGLLAVRMGALCATPAHRVELTERILAAVELERAAINGTPLKRGGGQGLMREMSDHLRALLRDVICGHLTADLPGLADELLATPGEAADEMEPMEELLAEPPAEPALAEPVLAEPVLF